MAFSIWLRGLSKEQEIDKDIALDIFESLEYVTDLKLLSGHDKSENGLSVLQKINDYTKIQMYNPVPGLYIFHHLFYGNLRSIVNKCAGWGGSSALRVAFL